LILRTVTKYSTAAYNVIIHAVPGTICRHYVAVVVTRAGTVSLVYEHAIQPISVVVGRVLTATIADIRLDVKYFREHNVTSYLSAHHPVPVQTFTVHFKMILPQPNFSLTDQVCIETLVLIKFTEKVYKL